MTPEDLKKIENAIANGFARSVKQINKGSDSSYKKQTKSDSGPSQDIDTGGREDSFFPVLDRLKRATPSAALRSAIDKVQTGLDKTFALSRVYGTFQAAFEAFVLPTTREFFTEMKQEFGDFEKGFGDCGEVVFEL